MSVTPEPAFAPGRPSPSSAREACGQLPYDGVSPQVLAGVLRICTHPKIYRQPSTVTETLAFCEALLEPVHSTLVHPGDRHWSIFADLCTSTKVPGNLVQDAWFAALAIEYGCQWISTDADYDRFRGLRWQRPFE